MKSKKVDISDQQNIALGLIRTGYNDYIAARVLLNKNYVMQGVILASTAMEKYFKALVVYFSGVIIPVHFDRFHLIRKAVDEIGYQVIFKKIDSRFFEILTQAYPLRYYDNITKPTTLGFFKNQFLGELDSAVYWFDQILPITNDTGEVISPLRQDLKAGNPDLLENNWIAHKPLDKKKFMETNCEAFAIYIHPLKLFSEVHLSSKKLNSTYNDRMWLITIKPDTES